jgi:hypothetical protein
VLFEKCLLAVFGADRPDRKGAARAAVTRDMTSIIESQRLRVASSSCV